MHYMEVGDDNLSFAIWTGSDPDAEIFTMTVSSPEKKKDWLLALQKLQESQISFAMGKRIITFLDLTQFSRPTIKKQQQLNTRHLGI